MQARDKMRYITQLLRNGLLSINALVALLLICSAYSPHFSPYTFPVGSCLGLFFPVCLLLNLLFLVIWLFVYRRYILFPILVLLVCSGAIRSYFPINGWGKEPSEESLKILSYNTRAFGLKARHTKEKANEVLAYLQGSDADIICLQEYIWGDKLKKKDIDYALRKYKYKHYQPLGKGLNGLGIYSRYPILSATPIIYKSNRNGSIAYRVRVKNDTLLIINNHLESNKILESDVEAYHDMVDSPSGKKLLAGTRKLLQKMADATRIRAAQADTLLKYIQCATDEHIIVCGDLNDTPVSYTYHTFRRELKDAFAESGNGLGITYNQHRLYFRIDHIFVSKHLEIDDCVVDNSIKASDHYPVVCNISLK